MKRKGETNMLGVMMVTFIGVLVGLVLVGDAIFPQVGEITTTATVTNQTFATTSSQITLPGKSVSNMVLYNSTGVPVGTVGTGANAFFNSSNIIPATNYTIANNQIDATDGTLVSILTWTAGGYNGSVNASFVTQPDTYIADSGARSVALLIAIFSALAIVVVAMAPNLRSGVMDLVKR